MKLLINTFALLFLTSFYATAQRTMIASIEPTTTKQSGTLTIKLTNLESDEGQLMVGLYNTENSWLSTTYKGESTSIVNGTATVVFKDIPYGTYAASAVHDIDKNGKMKTVMFGIPAEPYASSRGATGMFGPPKWEDAQFSISNSTSSEIIKF